MEILKSWGISWNTWNRRWNVTLASMDLKIKHNQNSDYGKSWKWPCQAGWSTAQGRGFRTLGYSKHFARWLSGGPKNENICSSRKCFGKVSQSFSRRNLDALPCKTMALPSPPIKQWHFCENFKGMPFAFHLAILVWFLLSSFCFLPSLKKSLNETHFSSVNMWEITTARTHYIDLLNS